MRVVPAGRGARGIGLRAPFGGGGPARLQLVLWNADGVEDRTAASDPADRALLDRLASDLESEFYFFSDQDGGTGRGADPRPASAADSLERESPER